MAADIDVRHGLFGSDASYAWEGIGVGVGLFVLVGAYAFVSSAVALPLGREVLSLFVGAGLVLAAVSAYLEGGLLVSLILALAPVSGALTFYQWSAIQQGVVPVALPFSLYGRDAVLFWLLTALVLGTLCFAVGVLARWARGYVVAR